MIKTIRIFISSPNDVRDERKKAQSVIERLQDDYAEKLILSPVFWEDLPLHVGESFQKGIDPILSIDKGIDIAIFILWSRLGTPLDSTYTKEDGSSYLSGTEYELDLMLKAYMQSNKERPKILVYIRDDDKGFYKNLERKSENKDQCMEDMKQKELLKNFIQEYFYDAETGSYRRAFHEYDRPHTFSDRLRVHLKDILDKFTNSSDQIWNFNELGSPYRGLEVFEINHAKIFRGRNQEICDIQQALRNQAEKGKAFLLLVGASGSGKSSLVRAGVIPTIMDYELDDDVSQWRVAIMTPNQSPHDLCDGLAKALCEENALPELIHNSFSAKDLEISFYKNPELACKMSLLNVLERLENEKSEKVKLILFIDQLEELFVNPVIGIADANAFLHAIKTLCECGSVWVIATLRSDFYHKTQQFKDLTELKKDSGQIDVLPPERASLRDIILEPAMLAGLRFEENTKTKESLATRILNDAMQNTEALPLVEYTLNELFKRRSKENTLSFEQYKLLGGIEGAIGKRAEEIFAKLSNEAKSVTPRLFRSLATIDNQGQFTSRSINITEISKDESINDVIESYLESRLIIIQKNKDGNNILKIAHEALFKSWERYDKWLNEAKKFLEIRQKLEFSMKRYMEENNNSLENYFAENRDILAECEPLSGGSELFTDEAEFIFRSSLWSGLQMFEWSTRLKNDYPDIRLKVIVEALNNNQASVRKNIATLLAKDPVEEVMDKLVEIAVFDLDESVRQEASKTLAILDRPNLYQKVIDFLKKQDFATAAKTALAYMQMIADQRGKSPEFYTSIKKLKNTLGKKIYWQSTIFRAKEFLVIAPFLVIPTILFASITATFFKSIPGSLNWAVSQQEASVMMGAFHGATAGVIWAGLIVLGITTYYSVYGKENFQGSMFNPAGAISTGAFVGFVSSIFIIIVIVGVYTPEALAKMGWIITSSDSEGFKRYSDLFWYELFVTTKFGWCYLITGTGLGIGIALSVNYLKSSHTWLNFIFVQEKQISSWIELKNITVSVMKIVIKYIAPLIIMLSITGVIAAMVPDIVDMEIAEKYKKASPLHLYLGMLADCATQAFGAYFAIVGMCLGLVMVKNGIHVRPMEKF
ncbi:MAG: ATP-binding protein [Nitrosomonas sp.]|nr:ATP-binding protein [Nitrosomonas sp.]